MGTSGYCRDSLDRRGQGLVVQGPNRGVHAYVRRACQAACLIVACFAPSPALAENQLRSWSSYFGDHRLSKHWGFHFDGQFRKDLREDWNQSLLRPGVNFYLGKKVFLSQGYAWIRTESRTTVTPEHRSWQQVQYMPKALGVVMSHRFRLEQRWISLPQGHRYQNRFRYFYRTEVPVSRRYFVGLQNEVFLGFGKNRGAAVYDQNRAYVSIGKRFGPIGRLETGYMYQNILLRDGVRREHNHILVVSFLSSRSREFR